MPEEILKEKFSSKVESSIEQNKPSAEKVEGKFYSFCDVVEKSEFFIPVIPFAEQQEGSDIVGLNIPIVPPEEEPIPEFFIHEVQIGDTLLGLSLRYNVPVY